MNELWKHVSEKSDSLVHVGVKLPGRQEGVVNGQIEISDAKKAQAIQHIASALSTKILKTDDLLPLIRLRLKNRGALQALANIPFVDYVEPAYFASKSGIWQDEKSGCDVDSWTGSVETVSPGDVKPTVWGLEEAWEKSTGDGITIGVVGTGVSADQPQLMSEFEDGQSGGRTLTKDYTYSYWDDNCGHETRLIGNMAAPRDGRSMVGIAYDASIYSVRVDNEPLLQSDSWQVMQGIERAANNSDIVNMAFGTPAHYEGIKDQIEYQYNRPSKPLFIGAAGTSPWFDVFVPNSDVVFPADMPEVVAVTGVSGDEIAPCESCHYGPEVEFSTGTDEPTLNPYSETVDFGESEIVSAGGSSYATSVISGLAALVWAKYPNWSREQVIFHLKSIGQPHHDSGLGYLGINASCAVGDFCGAYVSGPKIIEEAGTYTWEVDVQYTGTHSLSYEWKWIDQNLNTEPMSGTTSTSRYVQLSDTGFDAHPMVRVIVTENGTGETLTAGKGLIVRAKESECSELAGDCTIGIGE